MALKLIKITSLSLVLLYSLTRQFIIICPQSDTKNVLQEEIYIHKQMAPMPRHINKGEQLRDVMLIRLICFTRVIICRQQTFDMNMFTETSSTVKSLGIVGINCGRSLSNALYLIENMLNSHTYHTFLRLCRHSNLISLIFSSTVCLWLIVCFPSHVNCKNKVEDEKHFILYCPLYKNLRNKYII